MGNNSVKQTLLINEDEVPKKGFSFSRSISQFSTNNDKDHSISEGDLKELREIYQQEGKSRSSTLSEPATELVSGAPYYPSFGVVQ